MTSGDAPLVYNSSWAVVMDLTWTAAFTTPVRYKFVGTAGANNDMLIQNPAAVNGQPIGATGDMIAAQIMVKGLNYQPPAFRIAQTVTKQG